MEHEIAHGGFALGGLRRVVAPDLRLLEGGDVFGNPVVQPDLALVHQHERGGGGDPLGHRVDAEHGVVAHRLAQFEVHLTKGFEIAWVS